MFTEELQMLKYSLTILLHIGKLKCAAYIVFHGLKVNDVFTFLHSPDTILFCNGSSAVVYSIRTSSC